MINATIKAVNKAMLLAVALILSVGAANAQDVFISEYIEGSSNNKAIELYNGSSEEVDLGNYLLLRSNNGAPEWTSGELRLTGTLASGAVYVIANPSADPVILAAADITDAITFYNGDDAIGLFKITGSDTTLIDIFGKLGEDPGSGWDVAGIASATGERTLVRKPNFESGNTVALASFGNDEAFSEWIVLDQDDFSSIGSHTVGGVPFTVRELNRYRELTEFSVAGLQAHPLADEQVTITVVLTSYPKSSGVASVDDEDGDGTPELPGRLHFFVIDTSAVSMGRSGMSFQVVEALSTEDNAFKFDGPAITSIQDRTIGDVVTLTGDVEYFNGTMQFDIEAEPELLGNVKEEGGGFEQYASLLDPWEVNLSEINTFENGELAMNFANYSKYNGSYVKLTSSTISNVTQAARVDWAINKDESRIYAYDLSLRYRNDRAADYPDNWNRRRGDDGDFIAPVSGANADVSGYLGYQGDDPDGLVPANNGAFSIYPMEDGVLWLSGTRLVNGENGFVWPNDLVVNGLPPVVSNAALSDSAVSSSDEITVTVDAEAAEGTITSVLLIYTAGAESDTLTMTSTGGIGYSVQLPAFPNFTPVSFYIEATDDNELTGRGPFSGNYGFFVTDDVLSSLSFIQKTGDEQPGDSPLAGSGPVPVNITATVTTSASLDGFITIQDRATLWSGVEVIATNGADGLGEGDQINISELIVSESFGVTLVELTAFTNLNSPNTQMDTLAVEAITQDVRANPEPYEGLLVKFNDVKVTSNQADGSSDFGEWEFGSRQGGGAADTLEAGQGLRFDDRSSRFGSGVNEYIKVGAQFESLTAIGYFSFSNPKMIGGNPDFFVSDDFTIPFTNFDLETPTDGASVVVTGDVSVTWEATTDFDGNAVTYEWVLYSEDNSEVIAKVPSNNDGADAEVTLTFATVDGLLSGAGLAVGESANFTWNVLVNDGVDTVAVSSAYDITTNSFTPLYYDITLERGLGTGNDSETGVPDKFALEQNYPNPFNPSTSVNFSLPQTSKVTLTVYDMLGRRVATLLNNEQLNAANHSVKFDASALASGMYIYRIEAGSFVSTRKMMLIK
tara:strand:- start:112187 stop:115411 length:3225 start_codon:yes stop_codon:yes gene_type:complete